MLPVADKLLCMKYILSPFFIYFHKLHLIYRLTVILIFVKILSFVRFIVIVKVEYPFRIDE
jgi:hypothetical protein